MKPRTLAMRREARTPPPGAGPPALAALRAWLFLVLLLVFFETWAGRAYGATFLLNPYNLQSIALFAAAPLLLALGQTFVIIAGGIDLSVGFVMGLAAVVMARVMQALTPPSPAPRAARLGLVAAVLIALVPGLINGTLISRLRVPPFIGTLGMYGVARGAGFLAANGTTVPVNNPWLFAMGNGQLLGVPVPRGHHHRRSCWSCTGCCRRPASASTPTPSAATAPPRCAPASTSAATRCCST